MPSYTNHQMRPHHLLLALTLTAAQAHAQWDIEDSHSTASLRGIHNVGGGVAWASGTNGTVLRSEDGGYLWQTCTIPPGAEKLDFRGIQAFDENTAIVMSSGTGDLSRLYKTTDGCQTWKLLFTNPDKEGFWDAIQFTKRDYTRRKGSCFGILLGDPVGGHFPIFISLDCGDTWSRQTTLPKTLSNESVFAASNSSLSVTADRSFVTGGTSGARVLDFSTYVDSDAPERLHQTNHQLYQINTWYSNVLPNKYTSESSGGFSISVTERKGQYLTVVVGGDYRNPATRDGTAWYWGSHLDKWGYQSAQTPPHGFRSAVAYDAQQKLWITVGPNGTDISRDDGKNWTPLKPSPTEPPDADKNWNALSLPFVVGPKGRIGRLRTIPNPPK
jgi:hypothetical protein